MSAASRTWNRCWDGRSPAKANATLDSDDKAAKLIVDSPRRRDARDGCDQQSRVERHRHRSSRPSQIVDGTFTADGISAGNAKSVSARVTANGPIDAIGRQRHRRCAVDRRRARRN